MSSETVVYRLIFPEIPDGQLIANLKVGIHITPIGKIPEAEIAVFCCGCDHLQPPNTCGELDSNTQAINAENKLCEVSKVNSAKGRMTEDGFIPK